MRPTSKVESSDISTSQVEAGISINGLTGKSTAQLNQTFSDISKLGITLIRTDVQWRYVQDNNTRQHVWNLYDAIVAAANRYHLKVLGILDYAPAWAAQAGCIVPSSCSPANPATFAEFAGQAAAHYGQRVQDWEIWNEENSTKFWSPAPNAQQYAEVLKDSYIAIKKVSPTANVVLGGMTPGDNSGNIDPVQFLQQLYEDGAQGSFDAVGYHPYTYPVVPSNASKAWAEMADTTPSLRSVMQAHGDGAKQIWITEYGAPTNGPAGSGFVSETQQAQLARDAFAAIQGKPWIGPFFWYTYQDAGTSTSTKENFFGLKTAEGTPKPAYYTWQQLLHNN